MQRQQLGEAMAPNRIKIRNSHVYHKGSTSTKTFLCILGSLTGEKKDEALGWELTSLKRLAWELNYRTDLLNEE
ncbi:Hypothetical predicted protein [Podarcis lilfordi]|uniref:Uncharacterized protein n=1 Tax=Podarcis lilfordi TaxID=74358 RepID=A0AA35JUN8_9SAUR|nr:Hypothetical predicted protein [Podarcis lilfordi]